MRLKGQFKATTCESAGARQIRRKLRADLQDRYDLPKVLPVPIELWITAAANIMSRAVATNKELAWAAGQLANAERLSRNIQTARWNRANRSESRARPDESHEARIARLQRWKREHEEKKVV